MADHQNPLDTSGYRQKHDSHPMPNKAIQGDLTPRMQLYMPLLVILQASKLEDSSKKKTPTVLTVAKGLQEFPNFDPKLPSKTPDLPKNHPKKKTVQRKKTTHISPQKVFKNSKQQHLPFNVCNLELFRLPI